MKELIKNEKARALIKKAVEEGIITYEEINEELGDDFPAENIEQLINEMLEQGIKIVDEEQLDELAEDELREKGIEDDDLLKYFINNPAIGDESIQRGILLPIYNIGPFDYEILINTTTKSEIPTEWVVFKNEVSLPLQVKRGRLAVEDIFMIMSWDYESNYSDFANEKSLNPQPAVEGVELNGDTGDTFDIPAGNYGVKVLGFLDVNEPDIFESKCGYELFFEKMDTLPIIPENIDVDKLDYKVKVISER